MCTGKIRPRQRVTSAAIYATRTLGKPSKRLKQLRRLIYPRGPNYPVTRTRVSSGCVHSTRTSVLRKLQLAVNVSVGQHARSWMNSFVMTYIINQSLGSRVVSVLDSGADGPGFKSQSRRCRVNSIRQTVHTHCASVHQAAKLVAALFRVVRVTASLAESNGSLPPGL